MTWRFPGLESGEARDLQRRINKQLDACGCSEGSVGLLAAIGGAFALWRVDWLPVHGWAVAVSAVAVWASGSGCGPREGCRASAGPAGLADYELFGRHTARQTIDTNSPIAKRGLPRQGQRLRCCGPRPAAAADSPLVGYWGSDSSAHVNFIGVDGHLHELYIAPGADGWVDNDLTSLA